MITLGIPYSIHTETRYIPLAFTFHLSDAYFQAPEVAYVPVKGLLLDSSLRVGKVLDKAYRLNDYYSVSIPYLEEWRSSPQFVLPIVLGLGVGGRLYGTTCRRVVQGVFKGGSVAGCHSCLMLLVVICSSCH